MGKKKNSRGNEGVAIRVNWKLLLKKLKKEGKIP